MTVADLGYVPRDWQREVHLRRRRFSVLALHRRAGKTKLGVMQLVDAAMRCTKQGGLFFYVAPELKQAHAICWRELKQTLEPARLAGAVEIREGDLSVTFRHNGAMVRLYGADNPDAMRGVRLDGVVMDEVAQMKPEVWHEIVQPALADRLGWALFIGTPKGINLFSELFFRATRRMDQGDDDWYAGRWTVHDTQSLDSDEVARLQKDMADNPTAWAREFLCDFTASAEDQLISLAQAEEAAGRNYQQRDIANSPVVIGCDPARFGEDRSVIVVRQGRVMFPPKILRNVDNMELAGHLSTVIQDKRPDAVFVDGGGGAGVIDRCRENGFDITEVQFGSKARDAHYKNRRTEMWAAMKEWVVEGGGWIPDMMSLKQELATPTYSFDSSGRMQLESKDQIRKRLESSSSPDIADALALTFAMPVQARKRAELTPPTPRKMHDPFAL